MENFFKYIKRNHMLWLWVVVFTAFSQGGMLLTDTVGIDTADAIRTMTANDIAAELSVGRQGIVWVKFLTGHILVNPLFAGVLTILALVMASMLWSYLFFTVSGIDNRMATGAFAFILNSSAIFMEVFYFKVQSAEIAIGMCLAALSLLFTYQWIAGNSENAGTSKQTIASGRGVTGFLYPVFAVLLMLVYMSIYQALVMLFVVGAQMCFCLHFRHDTAKTRTTADTGISVKTHTSEKNNASVKPGTFILKFILVFLVGFGANELISKLFFSAGTAYIDKLFLWGTHPLTECLYNVGAYSFKALVGIGVHYPATYLPMAILAAICFLRCESSTQPDKAALPGTPGRWLITLNLLFLIISPAYLPIAIGGRIPARAQMTLPFVLAFFAWLLFVSVTDTAEPAHQGLTLRRMGITLGMLFTVLTCYLQVWADLDLAYTDQMRYRTDSLIAHDLIRAIDEIQYSASRADAATDAISADAATDTVIRNQITPPYPVAFVGSFEKPLNPSCVMGETIGHSMFAWDTEADPAGVWSGGRCLAFLSCFGADYELADEGQIAEIYADPTVQAMPCYPAADCVQLHDDVIVVKLWMP